MASAGYKHILTVEPYWEFVRRLFAKRHEGIEGMLHAASGMSGEAAELIDCILGINAKAGAVLDAVKKGFVYDKPINREKLIEELGDEMFYVVAMCNLLGVTLSEVMEGNVTKLLKRYPQGYTDKAAIERADQVQA